MAFKVGDVVRVRCGTQTYELLEPWADQGARVVGVEQVDDHEVRITVVYDNPEPGFASYLSAEDFVVDASRPGEPF